MAKHMPGVVVGALGALGAAWLGGVVVAAGGVPVWAVPVAVGGVALAVAVAWLLGRISHGGGEWSGGRGRAKRKVRAGSRGTLVRQHV